MKLDIVSLCVLKVISEHESGIGITILDRKVHDLIEKFSSHGTLLSCSMGIYLSDTITQLGKIGVIEEKYPYHLTDKGRKLITEETNQWIHAILTLAGDKTAKVLCPKCHADYMIVTDSEIRCDERFFNRHVSCNKCGVYNDMKIENELFRLPQG